MKKAGKFVSMLIAWGLMTTASGQNLVQNPGFEAVPNWDDFWVLSTVTPSTPTALATLVTTDAHEGSQCVQLSNAGFNRWTYMFTDTVTAPLSFEAGKSYRVSGWLRSLEAGKRVDLSIFWNKDQEMLLFYSGNPNPVSDPDWFEVADTISVTETCSDGYLSLGFQTGKSGSKSAGKLLMDDFSVTVIPENNETDITAYSIPQQSGPATIDAVAGTVFVEVVESADLTALAADVITLSRGATVTPAAGDTVDFSSPVIYTVVAQDRVTTRDWTVTVVRQPRTQTDVVSFTLAEELHPANIDNTLHMVLAEVVYGTDVTALIPTIGVSPGATSNPASGIPTDFSSPVVYRVTAEDGITTQDYIVSVTVSTLLNQTDITSFTLAEQSGPATIDPVLHTVEIAVTYGTDRTALVPAIGLSAGASVDPAGGVAHDFTAPAVYTVTAEDGVTVQDWTVSVSESLRTGTDIMTFVLAEAVGPATIDPALHTVEVTVPAGTDVTALVPSITLSNGATVDPAGGVAADFTGPVTYTVTAEDGITIQDWTITVTPLLFTGTDITAFSLAEEIGPATIDGTLHTVEVPVPAGTDVTALVPSITLSNGATVDPAGGVAADFTGPVTYTVTAEDGITIQEWTVSVVVQLRTGTDIVSFSLAEEIGPATIDGTLHTVEVAVPTGTDVTALVPAITLSGGATVDPAGSVAADFTGPVTYTVTAEDGITVQEWTVSVVVQLRTGTDIVTFSLAEEAGAATIDGTLHTVEVAVPAGTDVTALVPSITLSGGATVDPAGGVAVDFTGPVTYTVTAEDGITIQEWTVSVLVLLRTGTDIVSFSLTEQTGPAAIDGTLHTVEIEVAKGTDLSGLVPDIVLSDGATVDPASGVATDFSSAVTYTVTAEDGMTTQTWTVTVTLDPAVSIEDHLSPLPEVSIYPNPAREMVHVELSEAGEIYLSDIMGRVAVALPDAGERVLIPVSHLDRGIYFIQYIRSGKKQVFRIILE